MTIASHLARARSDRVRKEEAAGPSCELGALAEISMGHRMLIVKENTEQVLHSSSRSVRKARGAGSRMPRGRAEEEASAGIEAG